MSRLEYLARPLVAFDPCNKDHRRFYAEFVESGTWGRCPVRFICPDDFGGDLVNLIKNNLIQYYVDREFGGSKLSEARSQALSESADALYTKAAALRKEAAALKAPRRT